MPPSPPPPPPPFVPTATPPSDKGNIPDFDNGDICNELANEVASNREDVKDATEWIGYAGEGLTEEQGWRNPLYPSSSAIMRDLRKFVLDAVAGTVKVANVFARSILLNRRGEPQAGAITALGYASTLGVVTWLERVSGMPLAYLATPHAQSMRVAFPVEIPSQADLDILFLTKRIDQSRWECLTKANGNLPGLANLVKGTKQSRTNIPETIELVMREKLTPTEGLAEVEKLGVTSAQEYVKWLDLKTQYPPFGDIIRMMVRDVESDQAIADGKLDKGFADNYKGKLKKWAEYQGITPDVALDYWRAHWTWPSPTQLYEMLRRLRPGRVPKALEVDKDLVKRILEINDNAPAFIDRLVAISYTPITRTDLIKGYVNGGIDDGELLAGLEDVGYSPTDASKLVVVLGIENSRRLASASGQWTVRRILSHYRDNGIGRGQAETLLSRLYTDDQIVANLLDDADVLVSAETREKCVRQTRLRFLHGELMAREAKDVLQLFNIDLMEADRAVDGWACEMSSKRKDASTAMILKWRDDGIINTIVAGQRLVNLGYSVEDAQRILMSDDIMIKQKKDAAQAKAIEKTAKELKREQEKAKAELLRKKRAYLSWVQTNEKRKKAGLPPLPPLD